MTIRKLAELMAETGLSEIELAEGERRIRVSRATTTAAIVAAAPTRGDCSHCPRYRKPRPTWPTTRAPSLRRWSAPTYLQSEPGAPPFAEVGATVRVGDTLLIIEAMKVMNPIKAPRAGVVRQILVSDGQPVEYGEPLMIID